MSTYLAESRSLVTWEKGEGWRGREWLTRDMRKLQGKRNIFTSLGCGDGFMSIYICQNLPNCTLQVQLITCQVYLNKAVFKNVFRVYREQKRKSPLGNLVFKVAQFAWCPGSYVPLLKRYWRTSEHLGIPCLETASLALQGRCQVSQVKSLPRRENKHRCFVSDYQDFTETGDIELLLGPGLDFCYSSHLELWHPVPQRQSPSGSAEGPRACWETIFSRTTVIQSFTNILGRLRVVILGGTQVTCERIGHLGRRSLARGYRLSHRTQRSVLRGVLDAARQLGLGPAEHVSPGKENSFLCELNHLTDTKVSALNLYTILTPQTRGLQTTSLRLTQPTAYLCK